MSIKLRIATADLVLIEQIVTRLIPMSKRANVEADRDTWLYYIAGCHAHGCPLNLEELATCDDRAFAEDVFGIRAHWDKYGDCIRDWRPRCAL